MTENCNCDNVQEEVVELSSCISPDSPAMKFFYNGCEIRVKSVKFSPNGEVESVVTYYEEELSGPLLTYEKYLLEVPGVGFLRPGTRVMLDDKDYVLLFGWHTNGSNQTIFSWYLSPRFENLPDKTLYKSDINRINRFTFV